MPILAAITALSIVAAVAVASIDGTDGGASAPAPVATAPAASAPREVVPVPVPAAPPAAPAPAAPAADAEDALTAQLRATVDEQPQVALTIADQVDAAFPSGRYADERAWLRMRALVHLGDIGKARTIAGEFFERHPQSPYGPQVWRLTGMSPRRIGPPS